MTLDLDLGAPEPEPPPPPERSASAPDDAGPPSWPVIPGRVALWRLYLVSVASFLLYLPYWVWRTARQFGVGQRRWGTPVWWAVGTAVPMVAAAVLYELNRRARRLGQKPGPVGGPSLALLGLSVLGLTPFARYVPLVVLVLLVPIPFLFVQRNINRAAARRPERAHPRRSLGVALAVAFAVGLPLHAASAYFWDWSTFQQALSPRLAGGSRVAGECLLYELTLPSTQWRRAPSGTLSEDPTDLELLGPGEDTWAVAYVEPSADYDLETSVQLRRDLIFEHGASHEYQEKRFFLAGTEDFVPASQATVDVGYGVAGAGRFVVATAEFETKVVEVVGYTAQPNQHGSELTALVESLAPRAVEGTP